MKKFETPKAAELAYACQVASAQAPSTCILITTSTMGTKLLITLHVLSLHVIGTQTPSIPISTVGIQTDACTKFDLLALSTQFTEVCKAELWLIVPQDFLQCSAAAMYQLAMNDRSNVLYALARGIGTMRDDQSDSRFPTKRMPMGLLEYSANFFLADNINQV